MENNKTNMEKILDNFLKLPYQCQLEFFKAITICPWDIESLHSFLNGSKFDYSDCESPIEMMVAIAFDMVRTLDTNYESIEVFRQRYIKTDNGKTYRVDFLLASPLLLKAIVVECDGHEFHHATKEQVVHDNERDYDLKMSGYEVLHFSGRQINEHPFKVAHQCYEFALQELKNE